MFAAWRFLLLHLWSRLLTSLSLVGSSVWGSWPLRVTMWRLPWRRSRRRRCPSRGRVRRAGLGVSSQRPQSIRIRMWRRCLQPAVLRSASTKQLRRRRVPWRWGNASRGFGRPRQRMRARQIAGQRHWARGALRAPSRLGLSAPRPRRCPTWQGGKPNARGRGCAHWSSFSGRRAPSPLRQCSKDLFRAGRRCPASARLLPTEWPRTSRWRSCERRAVRSSAWLSAPRRAHCFCARGLVGGRR